MKIDLRFTLELEGDFNLIVFDFNCYHPVENNVVRSLLHRANTLCDNK